MTTAIQKTEGNGGAIQRYPDDELTVQEIVAQVKKVQDVMAAVMKVDEHYGVIPGTGSKPTLLKAGAEKLCLLFRLAPEYEITEHWDGQHLTVHSKCTLKHVVSGTWRGTGMGSCSTRESKYAYRQGSRKCPQCGKEAIIQGKAKYGGGWLCFAKKGGCGAKFKTGDAKIEKQSIGRVANEDLADSYNTVLKMANKRSLVAATLNATAASDIFTQDVEDLPQYAEPPKQEQKPKPAAKPEPIVYDNPDPWFERIADAADQHDLDAIGSEIKAAAFTDEDRAELRQAWNARKADLRKRPAREPGEDA